MFRFRLQRVLELREKKEQAQARELAKAQHAAEAARQQRDSIAELRTASRAEMSAATDAAPTVGHLHHLGFVLSALDQRLDHAGKVVENAEGVVQQARTSLDDAARDRRVMDRLKGKHAETHRVDEAQKDRLQMDEIALARYGRARDLAQTDATGGGNSTPADATNNSAGAMRSSTHDGTAGQ